MKKKIIDNIKTLFYALIIALFIRSLFFQPFYIPSSSMEPNLLIGDRLFVSKYSYGYSRHSFPFSLKIFTGRILEKSPKRGDVIVFKTPADNRTDYIKRLIGLPGDVIQIINKDLYLNDIKIKKEKIETSSNINCGNEILEADFFEDKFSVKGRAIFLSKRGRDEKKFILPYIHVDSLYDGALQNLFSKAGTYSVMGMVRETKLDNGSIAWNMSVNDSRQVSTHAPSDIFKARWG